MTLVSFYRDGATIIPYQELLGNYDPVVCFLFKNGIIPYQELLGNYDSLVLYRTICPDYTIPRAIREL